MKKIGIFSKLSYPGGSEFRCKELANGIRKYTNCIPFLISENSIHDRIKEGLDCIFFENGLSYPELFYDLDELIIINTDSKEYTKREFWEKNNIKTEKIKSISFLFNFIISPSKNLQEWNRADIKIICGNSRFYKELETKDKFKNIIHLKRTILESPISEASVYDFKTSSDIIRIGKHSKGMDSKWNEGHIELIDRVNKKYKNSVIWDFMGVANNIKEQLKKFDNVILREENSIPVNVYLMNIDIFLFYISNTRHECWARANAEGLMSGCLSIATDVDGGNRDQIQHKKNGYLCKTVDDFYKRIVWFFDHKDEMENMGKYARRHALENFSTKRIIKKLEDFLNA